MPICASMPTYKIDECYVLVQDNIYRIEPDPAISNNYNINAVFQRTQERKIISET